MRSDCTIPVNIGSDEMISINYLVSLVASIAGKKVNINNIPGPIGVQGRHSDNRLIYEAQLEAVNVVKSRNFFNVQVD